MKIFGLEFKFNGFDIWHKGNMGSGSGLDSDKLDGKESSDFATAVQGDKADNALPAASYTASDVLVKLKTVDGSGSGLDADTLDSIDSIRMIYGMNGSGSNIPSTTQNVYDISQYKSGFWNVSGAPWTPTTDWYWGATFAHTGNTSSYNYAGQLIFRNSYGGSGLYARTISAGTPSAWSKLWSDSNDGSGSGLDADKLDGHESGNASDNIPISNGTVCVNLDADRVDGYDFNQSLKTTDSPTFANINANINPSRITGGYTGTGRMYLNTHPENGGAIVPFINNDLAFLTKKGGAMTSYKTTNTDYTPQALTNSGNVSIDTTNPFDGSPSYAQFSVSAVGDVIIIDITCHTVFAYTTSVYIDFGASYWSARNISFYAYNSSANNSETVYKPFGSVTNSSIGEYCSTGSYTYVDKNGVTQQGFNKLRIVLTNFNTTSPRIACIGVIGFGSSGLKETFISRGGSSIYGDFYPLIDNSYVLGGSSNRWKNVYAVAFNGSLVGNADSASKWSTARTLSLSGDVSGSTTIDGSGNASITATVADDSHNHIITNIDGLQTALDSKANSASPIFTGTPTAPTPATTDNSKNIATTEFVKAQGYITSAGSGAKIAVNPTEPTSPQPGDFWFKVL